MTDYPDIPTVLSIAGSDPSGGAGVQADLKTFMATGVYGAAVITGLTVQNTLSVSDALPVSPDFVAKQIEAVLSDIHIGIIKLGMLPNREICQSIAPFLDKCPVVCDPVMVSTSGYQLIDDPAIDALIEHVIPLSDYLTPNVYELEILCGGPIRDIKASGIAVMNQFPHLKGIVLKGGHVENGSRQVIDRLLYRSEGKIREEVESHPRIETENTHGTGCTFSSAFSAFLARKFKVSEAFSMAVKFTNKLILFSREQRLGHGHGPLLHHKMCRNG